MEQAAFLQGKVREWCESWWLVGWLELVDWSWVVGWFVLFFFRPILGGIDCCVFCVLNVFSVSR